MASNEDWPTAVRLIVIDVIGRLPWRVDVMGIGSGKPSLSVQLGTCLVKTTNPSLIYRVREVFDSGQIYLPRLSPVSDPDWLGKIMTPVSVIVDAHSARTALTAALMAPPGERAHVRMQLGPVNWRIWDREAYGQMVKAWRKAEEQLSQA